MEAAPAHLRRHLHTVADLGWGKKRDAVHVPARGKEKGKRLRHKTNLRGETALTRWTGGTNEALQMNCADPGSQTFGLKSSDSDCRPLGTLRGDVGARKGEQPLQPTP